MMKKLLLIISTFFVLVIGLAIGAPFLISWDGYKQTAQDQIKELSGLDVTFGGDVSLSVIPMPRVILNDVSIRNPANQASKDLMTFERLSLSMALQPLFSGKVHIQGIEIRKPLITLHVDAGGQQNWVTPQIQALLSKEKSQAQVQQSAPSNASNEQEEQASFSFKTIKIIDGAFGLVNEQSGSNTAIRDIDFNIKANNEEEVPFYSFNGALNIFEQALLLKGQATLPLANSSDRRMMLETQMAHEATGAIFDFNGQANLEAPFETTGQLVLDADDLSVVTSYFDLDLPANIGKKLSFSATLNASQNEIALSNIGGIFGENDVLGQGRVQFSPLLVNLSLESLRNQLGIFTALNVRAAKSGAAILINDTSLTLGYDNKIFLDGRYKTKQQVADLSLRAQLEDLPAFLTLAGLDVELPKDLERLDFQSTINGKLDKLNYDARLRALGGEVNVRGKIAPPYDLTTLSQVNFVLSHPDAARLFKTLQGTDDAPISGALRISANAQGGDQSVALSNLSLSIDQSQFTGSLSADLSGARPFIKSDLNFTDFAWAPKEIQSAPKSVGGSTRSSSTQERWSSDPINVEALQSVNFDIALSGQSLQYQNWDVTNPNIQATLNNGTLEVKQLSGGMYGGTFDIIAQLQALPEQPVTLRASPKVQNVSLEPFISSFVGSKILGGSGWVSLDSSVQTTGFSQAEFVNNLSGQGSITGSSLVLDGIDLKRFARALSEEGKPGDTISMLWGGASEGGSTNFDQLDGAFSVDQGVMNFTKLDLLSTDADITTTGNINLPGWRVDTDHTITIKDEDVPPFTIEIDGPLDNPAQTFGQGLLEDYLKRKLQRKIQQGLGDVIQDKIGGDLGNALGGLLGGGSSRQQQQAPANDNLQPQPSQQQQPAQQEIDPEEALRGLLQGILR